MKRYRERRPRLHSQGAFTANTRTESLSHQGVGVSKHVRREAISIKDEKILLILE
jgi:hypothetical protein